jgi:hypothetical protein
MNVKSLWQGLAELENNAGPGFVTTSSFGVTWIPHKSERVSYMRCKMPVVVASLVKMGWQFLPTPHINRPEDCCYMLLENFDT